MIAIVVNGKRRNIDGPTDIPKLLDSLGITGRHFAVAHNGTVLRRDELPGVTIDEGDRLEIVRAVGGG